MRVRSLLIPAAVMAVLGLCGGAGYGVSTVETRLDDQRGRIAHLEASVPSPTVTTSTTSTTALPASSVSPEEIQALRNEMKATQDQLGTLHTETGKALRSHDASIRCLIDAAYSGTVGRKAC